MDGRRAVFVLDRYGWTALAQVNTSRWLVGCCLVGVALVACTNQSPGLVLLIVLMGGSTWLAIRPGRSTLEGEAYSVLGDFRHDDRLTTGRFFLVGACALAFVTNPEEPVVMAAVVRRSQVRWDGNRGMAPAWLVQCSQNVGMQTGGTSVGVTYDATTQMYWLQHTAMTQGLAVLKPATRGELIELIRLLSQY
jgi:hypothetical protein